MTPSSATPHDPGAEPRTALDRFGPPLLYLLGAALLWRHFDFIYYKDELSYLSAAARYASGDLGGVNAYWAPLLSWLLAPLLAIGLPPATASDVASVIGGVFALEGARALTRTLGARGWLARVLDLSLVIVTLYCAMLFLSADLLLAGVLSWYLSIVLRDDYPARARSGALAGALGAVAYFAKTYAFYFFVVHFLVVHLAHWLRGEPEVRRRVWRQMRNGYLVFGALSALWVGAVHAKYGVVTLGITGDYNHRIVGPEARNRPILEIGFDGAPRPGNTSVWEDPIDFYKVPSALECCLKSWSPLSSVATMKHQLRLVKKNVAATLEVFQLFSSLSYGVVVLCFLLCIPSREDARRHWVLGVALFTLALYSAGYTLVYSEERYLWPMLYLLIAMSGYLLQVGFRTAWLANRRRQQLLAALIALSFVKVPLSKLLGAREYGRSTSLFVEALGDTDLRGKRLASNADYGASTIVAFYKSAQYLGQKRPGATPEQVMAELKRARADYYLVWGGVPSDSATPGLTRVKDVRLDPGKVGNSALSILRVD